MVVGPSIGGWCASDVWSVRVLRNLEFLKLFKSSRFLNSDFLKLQFPPEVTKISRQLLKIKLLFPPELIVPTIL